MSDRIKIVCMDCACKRTIALHKWNEAERFQGTIRTSAMLSARFAMDTRCIDTTEVSADE